MFIKSIHIENFGNFSDKDFDFHEGVNNFIQDNGWGKSTLSAFIKAMFYGLDERGSKRKADIFVERERYLPWNGGNFGGSLVFNFENKDYKIRRIFDDKKCNNDSFSVTDMQTNKETSKFSSNIGNEIFGINKESFERSCFVTLDSSKIPELNDDIAGKLNNILESGDDIGNCQLALDSIAKTVTSLDSRSKNAKSTILNSNIEECKRKLLEINSLEKTIPNLKELLENAKTERKVSEENIEKLEKEKDNIQLYEQQKHYKLLLNELKTVSENKNNIEEFFAGNIPTDEVIDNLNNEQKTYTQALTDIEQNKVTNEEKTLFSELKLFFESNVPTNEEIENCQNLINKEKELKSELSRKELSSTEKNTLDGYKKQFNGTNINDETIKLQFSYVDKVQQLEKESSSKENEKSNLEEKIKKANDETKQKNKTRKIIFSLISVLLLVVGGVLIPFGSPLPLSIVLFVIGIGVFITGLVIKPKSKNSEQEKQLNQINNDLVNIVNNIDNYKNAYESFIKTVNPLPVINNPSYELSNIKSNYDSYKTLLAKEQEFESSCGNNQALTDISNQIKDFTAIYEAKCATSDVDSILRILRNKKTEYDRLNTRIPRYDNSIEISKASEKKLQDWLSNYKVNKTTSFDKQIDELKTKKIELNQNEQSKSRLEKEIEEFEQNNNMEAINSAKESLKTPTEIAEEIKIEKDHNQKAISNINAYKEKLDQSYAEIDKKDSIENEKQVLEANLSEVKKRVQVLNKTTSLLQKAKDSLSTKYMGKMEGAFSKYLNLIDDNKNISIDNELTVKVEGGGEVYDKKYLSEGYKDIVNFCTRLALVDAMFEEEKPLVVLDDPFVNLDKDKIENALQIVQGIAKDKQVIYFTCHDSRELNI